MMPSRISCSGGLRPSHDNLWPPSLPLSERATVADRRYKLPGACTLLELLVVVAIIGLLMGLILPSIGSIMQGTNIEQGARAVFDQISLARQIASTRNCTTELRLINLAGVSPKGYSAMQIWIPGVGTNTNMQPATKVVNLPQSVVVSDDGTSLSKIVSLLATNTMPAGGSASGAPYVAFGIRPSGDVVPVPDANNRANLYLTVVPTRAATNTTLPPNYATIQLNPDTGTPLVFRP